MAQQCTRCGSSRLIPDIPLPDRSGEYGDIKDTVTIELHGNPGAWLRKDTAWGDLLVTICGDCGYSELKANNHRQLYLNYLRSVGRAQESELLSNEFNCLACGELIAGGSTHCPRCGWSWESREAEA